MGRNRKYKYYYFCPNQHLKELRLNKKGCRTLIRRIGCRNTNQVKIAMMLKTYIDKWITNNSKIATTRSKHVSYNDVLQNLEELEEEIIDNKLDY